MRRPFLLLVFSLVVVSHGDPTAFDDDNRPTDDTSTPARILVFSCCLVAFLFVVACALCYAMYNKRQQRQKLVPCDAYCTCPAHANHSSHFATRLESA